jgi:hypothetical protein
MSFSEADDHGWPPCVQAKGGARKRVQVPAKRQATPGTGTSTAPAGTGGRLGVTTTSSSIMACIPLDIALDINDPILSAHSGLNGGKPDFGLAQALP